MSIFGARRQLAGMTVLSGDEIDRVGSLRGHMELKMGHTEFKVGKVELLASKMTLPMGRVELPTTRGVSGMGRKEPMGCDAEPPVGRA